MKKKFLVVLLALTMVFAFSAAALADEPGDNAEKPIKTQAESTTIEIKLGGTTFSFPASKSTAEIEFASVDAASKAIEALGFEVKDSSLTVSNTNKDVTNNISVVGSSDVVVKITYQLDGKYYEIEKTFTAYVGSGDANLKDIKIEATATSGSPKASDIKIPTSSDYKDVDLTGHVDMDATGFKLALTLPTGAKATLDGSPLDTQNTKTLSFGNKNSLTPKIVVTAENGKQKTYNLTVTRDYDDTSITITPKGGSALKVGGRNDDTFTYTYPFDTKKGDKLEFDIVVANKYSADPAKADKDDISVSDSTNTMKVTFDTTPGNSEVEITVTAFNGDTEDYYLELEKGDPVQLDDMNIMIGDDNSRNDLDYIMFPSKFDEDVYDYYVFVPWDNEYKNDVDVYINAEFDSDDFTVKCGTKSMKDNDYINVGSVADGDKETFTLTVTNKDTKETSEYTVTVYYGSEKASDTDTLKDLDARYGSSFRTAATISPSFSSSIYNYVVSVPAKTDEVRLELRATDSDAIILCNDVEVDGRYITLSDLKAGENKFKVVVVAENCDDTKTYNITVNVGATGLLSNLSFSTNAGTFNFSPVFASGTYNYVANVPNSVTTLYVTPTAIDDDYTIRVYKGSTDAQTVKSGKTSTGIALTEGLNEVKVYVYQSGSSKTYTLNIYRQPTAPNYQVSVQKLYVNGTAKTLNAVNIKGNNFLKLRDLAYLLDGTSKQFNVTYTESTNTAHIHSLTSYVNDPKNPVNQPITLTRPQLSSQKVTLDGSSAYPIAYNVAGSNYVNLRQVCAMLDIGLTYSAATNTVTITTANSYTPGL